MWTILGLLALLLALCGLVFLCAGIFGGSEHFRQPGKSGEKTTRVAMLVVGAIILGLGGCLTIYSWSGSDAPKATIAQQATTAQLDGDDGAIAAIYGNWGDSERPNACPTNFEIFSPNSFGIFIYDPQYFDPAHLPPNHVTLKATYLSAPNGVIFVVAHGDGDKEPLLTAYRVTSPTTMDLLQIMLSDGSEYPRPIKTDHGFSAGPMPNPKTVKIGQPKEHFVRCGAETDEALAKAGILTANANAAKDAAMRRARQIIASDPMAGAVYEDYWVYKIQGKCHYVSNADELRLVLGLGGHNPKTEYLIRDSEFFGGMNNLLTQEVGRADCDAGQTKSKFSSDWRQIEPKLPRS